MSSELAVKNGINRQTYYTRINKGWTKEDAATRKPRPPKRPFTDDELSYLCKFYEVDGPTLIAEGLERHIKTVSKKYHQLRREGKLDYYKQLWEAIG